jgi:hypothetical protein
MVVFWFVFLFAISAAITALRIPALSAFISDVQAFLPNIVVAVLIFVLAAALAGVTAAAVGRLMGDTPTGRIVQAVVPGIILAIGGFMVLDQLHIAPQIVTITYAGLITLLVLSGGLAFGLGGREVAADMLRDAYDRGRSNEDLRFNRPRQNSGRLTRVGATAEDATQPAAPVAPPVRRPTTAT